MINAKTFHTFDTYTRVVTMATLWLSQEEVQTPEDGSYSHGNQRELEKTVIYTNQE